MVDKRQLASVFVALAIVASFYAASIGFGLVDRNPATLPVAQVSLVQAGCNTDRYIEQWQNSEITISELMQKFEAKKAGKSC